MKERHIPALLSNKGVYGGTRFHQRLLIWFQTYIVTHREPYLGLVMLSLGICFCEPVQAQTVTFNGPFTSLSQSQVTYGQGIVADAEGNLYISGTLNLLYLQRNANGSYTPASTKIDSFGGNAYGLAIDPANNLYRPDIAPNSYPALSKYTYKGVNSFTKASIGTWTAANRLSSAAVDANYNVYVLDAGATSGTTGSIVELLPSSSCTSLPACTTYTQVTLITDARLHSTTGLSIDGRGNFFVASGPITGDSQSTISNSTAAVYKLIPNGGSYTFSTLGTSWSSPAATTVDTLGNLWVADYGAQMMYELVPTSSSATETSYTVTPFQATTKFTCLRTLTVSKAGQLFGLESGGPGCNSYAIPEVGGTPPHNLGTPSVGASSTTQEVDVTFSLPQGAVNYKVVTQGSSSTNGFSDVTPSSGSTASGFPYCTEGTGAGYTCAVMAQFAPTTPGLELGSLLVLNANGAVIGTNYFYGVGYAPEAALSPGQVSKFTASLMISPASVAIDSFSNVYIADPGANLVHKVSAAGTVSTLAGTGVASTAAMQSCGNGSLATNTNLTISGLALDGAGNLYLADPTQNRVCAVNLSTGLLTTVAGTGAACSSATAACGDAGSATSAQLALGSASGLAVDSFNNLLIADSGDNRLRSVNLNTGLISTVAGTGGTCATTAACGDGGLAVAAGALLNAPTAVTVDALNDYFIADTGDNRIRELAELTGSLSTVAGSGTAGFAGDGASGTGAELNTPRGIAVDAAGDLYIADAGNNRIRMLSAGTGTITTVVGGGSFSPASNPAVATNASINNPESVAVDAYGNLFVADTGASLVAKVNTGAATLSFATPTVAGTVDNADGAETASLLNIGNVTLTSISPGITVPLDFEQLSGNTGDCTTGFSLAAGTSCAARMEFYPQSPGFLNESLVFTDNSLNASSATQAVALSGTSSKETLTASPANLTITFGQTPTLTATVSGGGVAPTGAVSFMVGSGVSVTATCSTSGSTETCTAAYPAAAALVAGNYTISTTAAADTNYLTATGTATLTVTQIAGTTSIAASGTGAYAAPTSPVTVTIPYTGNVAPAGAITITDTHGNTLTFPASSCTGTASPLSCTVNFPTANEPVGSNPLTLSQASDANYTSGSGTGTVMLSKAAVTAADTANGTGVYGTPTTPVTVVIPYSGTTPPTGTVTVSDSHGNTVTVPASNCTAAGGVLTCTASFPSANLPAGSDSLTVSQAGDTNYAGSTGTGAVVLNKAPATTADTASGTGTYGAPSTSIAVTIPYIGNTSPTGPITVSDSHGNTVTTPASNCTAAGGALTCSVNLPTANVSAGSDPLTVSQAGDANYAGSTGTGTVVLNKAPATTVDAASGTGVYGTPTTPVTVTIPFTGNTPPTGLVTVADSHGNTITVPASNCTSTGGVLTCVVSFPTASLPAGSDPVTVSQAGDGNYAGSTGTGTVVLGKAASTVADTAMGTGVFGAPTTPVTVTIPYTGTIPPTGIVTVADNHGNTVAVPASACTVAGGDLTCTANLPTANLAAGSDPLTVSQAGDSNNAGSTGTGTVVLSKVANTASDTAAGNGTFGSPTTPVTVTIPYSGTTPPTGPVTITDSHGNTVTVPASGCIAAAATLTCTVNFPTANLPAGSDSVTVNQAGDTNYTGSTGTGTVVLGKVAPSATDTASGTGTVGAPTTPVTVSIPYSGTTPPTGLVTVVDSHGNSVAVPPSSCTAAAGVLRCAASFPTANLPAGSDPVSVSQAADSNYAGSTGTGTVVLNKAVLTGILTSSATSLAPGQSATLTETLSAGNGVIPTGTVTFYDGATPVGTANLNSAAVATLLVSSLPAGTNNMTAVYSGDGHYASFTSNQVNIVVASVVNTGVSLTSSVNPQLVGQPITFTAAISSAVSGSAPTGTVSFYNGTQLLGTGTVNSAGLATFTTTSLPAGVLPITASYSGDSTHLRSTSQSLSQTVTDFTVSSSTPTLTVDAGQVANFLLNINPVAGTTFANAVALSYTGLPANFQTTFAPQTVTPGSAGTGSTMSVLTFANLVSAREKASPLGTYGTVFSALLLPLLGVRRLRRKLPRGLVLLVFILGGLGLVLPMTGCGGGYFGPAPATYTITVTGTSGTLQHSTTVTLNVR